VRVLVIGGSGFIGGALVRRLREVGVVGESGAPGVEVATFHRGEGADVRADRIRRELGFREGAAPDETMRRTVEDARVVR